MKYKLLALCVVATALACYADMPRPSPYPCCGSMGIVLLMVGISAAGALYAWRN